MSQNNAGRLYASASEPTQFPTQGQLLFYEPEFSAVFVSRASVHIGGSGRRINVVFPCFPAQSIQRKSYSFGADIFYFLSIHESSRMGSTRIRKLSHGRTTVSSGDNLSYMYHPLDCYGMPRLSVSASTSHGLSYYFIILAATLLLPIPRRRQQL